MFKILTLNKISALGLDCLPRELYESASELANPDAILVRSFVMHDWPIPPTVQAIARAGAGVNNIPIEVATEKGIVVFNTPGANANSVKELTITGMLLSSRLIVEGISWVRENAAHGQELAQMIEKGKGNFVGPELAGKRLGIIGLGAIGVKVANAAVALGMEVYGYDPTISVDHAWGLVKEVKRARSLDGMLSESDYLTLHIPLTDGTRGLLDRQKFMIIKPGCRILNFARGGLVVNEDILAALNSGQVSRYVTDFPDEILAAHPKVIPLPHLGASTPEAEDNCAIMAANQLREFLENGNITNSVNFPNCEMECSKATQRLIVANKNIPNMVGQITHLLASAQLNISDMLNRHKDNIAYNIIDINGVIPDQALDAIKSINGIIMVRRIIFQE